MINTEKETRMLNPSQVKVRVIRCDCDEPFRGQHEIRIELARDGTPQELEARKHLAKLFAEDRRVIGRGYRFRMYEGRLRDYEDWIILPYTLDEEIARWEREGERKPDGKVEVESINVSWMSHRKDEYIVHLQDVYENKNVSVLRKAIRTYRHRYATKDNCWYLFVETGGTSWTLTRDILCYFESWFEWPEPMDTLLAKADAEAERIRKEHRREYSYFNNPFGYIYSQSKQEIELNKAFNVFGLSRTATQDDVRKRYRQLAKLYHPDAGGKEEEFKRLNHANEILMQQFA